jgi:hypothetical protein
MGKPVILVADRNCPNRLPFDISPFKVLFYENTIAGRENVLRDFVGHLNAILPLYEPISRYYREISQGSRISY